MSTAITRPDGQSLTFDVAEVITVSPTLTVTEHPVEAGGAVSDHVQRRPTPITVRAKMTESPFGNEGGQARVDRALAFLRECEGQLLTLESDRVGVVSNLVLLGYPQRFTYVLDVPMDITLREIRIAKTGTVLLPPRVPRPSVQDSAPDEQDVGQQATEETGAPGEGDAEADVDRSKAAALLVGLGLFDG